MPGEVSWRSWLGLLMSLPGGRCKTTARARARAISPLSRNRWLPQERLKNGGAEEEVEEEEEAAAAAVAAAAVAA